MYREEVSLELRLVHSTYVHLYLQVHTVRQDTLLLYIQYCAQKTLRSTKFANTLRRFAKLYTRIYTNLQEVFMKVHEDFAKFSVHSTVVQYTHSVQS